MSLQGDLKMLKLIKNIIQFVFHLKPTYKQKQDFVKYHKVKLWHFRQKS